MSTLICQQSKQGALKISTKGMLPKEHASTITSLRFPVIQLGDNLHIVLENGNISSEKFLGLFISALKRQHWISDFKGPVIVAGKPNGDQKNDSTSLVLSLSEMKDKVDKFFNPPKSMFGFGTLFHKPAQTQVQPVPTPAVELSRPGLVN